MDGRFFINGYLLLILNPSGVLNNAVELLKRIEGADWIYVYFMGFSIVLGEGECFPKEKEGVCNTPLRR
ncbi:hypothetical protein CHU00_12610 [Sphingobacterium cellulitidis]|nr:hypothetical protein CHU00_12610 [Sphingobacterium cellulitidis]